MKKLNDIYANWNSSDGHGDKGTAHSYIEIYEQIMELYRGKRINILEVGLAYGESLELWSEYFGSKAKIYGIDIRDTEIKPYLEDERFKIVIDDATKPEILKNYKRNRFDIIIDDGSHKLQDQIDTFNIFKPRMKVGGVYIIEDVSNIDDVGNQFKSLHQDCTIVDRRRIKGRFDDVLVLYKF